LSDGARGVVDAVAAMFQPTTGRLAGLFGPALDDHLVEARGAGILAVDDHRVRFTHPLLGTVIYADMGEDRRGSLHARLAGIETNQEESAHHLARACQAPDAAVAVTLEAAAAAAAARSAVAAAADMAEQALALTPSDLVGDRARRARMAAEWRFWAGQTARAATLSDLAVELAPSGPELARALSQRWLILEGYAGPGVSADVLDEALAEAAGDAQLTGHVHDLLSRIDADREVAYRHSLAALEVGELTGDATLQMRALTTVVTNRVLADGSVDEEAVARALEIERAALERVGFEPIESFPRFLFAWAFAMCGDPDRAQPLLESSRELAARVGDESVDPFLAEADAFIQIARGRIGSALDLAADVMAAVERTEQPAYELVADIIEARALAHRGDVDTARERAASALAAAPRGGHLLQHACAAAAAGSAALLGGDAEEAVRQFELTDELLGRAGIHAPGFAQFRGDAVEALAHAGRLDAAADRASQLEDRGRMLGHRWAEAVGARSSGIVAAARGDAAEAEAAYTRAAGLLEDAGMPLDLARTLLARGELRRRGKRKAEARADLERARGLAEECEATLWAERAGGALARLGGRRSSAGLTETELAVARLVAEGRSNEEVARVLFISVNTVKSNLSRIYRKAGVKSRAELAASMAKLSPPAGE